ncbi:MAG: sulfatase-like hydrolase/transferase [Dysgonamonadaceae bacterium]|nr:sulfatase-like hydrolase/transferase [Dysgonamonadaceae bacterium]
MLAELDRQGLRENSIIVFWADHGYQLGEKGKWSKAGSLWEQGARVPFIILDPRAKGNGNASPRIVELLDIYPALVDLCGLPKHKELVAELHKLAADYVAGKTEKNTIL